MSRCCSKKILFFFSTEYFVTTIKYLPSSSGSSTISGSVLKCKEGKLSNLDLIHKCSPNNIKSYRHYRCNCAEGNNIFLDQEMFIPQS